jgi:tetratricopeptide (TPR) repeat protein
MKKLLILTFLIPFVIRTMAQPAEFHALMQQANQYYAENQYRAAIEMYEKILAGRYESPELYFNLGNSYFKEGDIPSAILFYEKALKLDPTDQDIRFNLDLANSRIIDKIEPLPEFFLKAWWRSARESLSSDQWARLAIIALILVLSSAFVFFAVRSVLLRKVSFWAGIAFIMLLFFSILFSTGSYRHYQQTGTAIIFTPTVTVKSSPNENSVDLFVIHEGTRVSIIDQVEGWSEIRLANGNVGWIKATVYRTI